MTKHEHDFHPISGWCSRCPYRNDGTLAGYDGVLYRAGTDWKPLDHTTRPLKEIPA